MSATHTNLYRSTDEDTVSLSIPAVIKLLTSDDMSPTAVVLYVHLLIAAARYGAPVFRLHTMDILAQTGLSRPTFLKARAALQGEYRLIHATETKKQGMWLFELLNVNGDSIPTPDLHVNFATLPAADVVAFYADRLGVSEAPDTTADGFPVFDCPFHVAATPKKQRTLRVTTDGEEHHGRFICNGKKCRRKGGLIDFEMGLAAEQKQPINRREASQRVRAFFIGRRQNEWLGVKPETPHPLLAELTERSDEIPF